MVEAFRLHGGEHRLVDRGDRAGMAAREGDQVLIGLFRRGDARPQIGDRPVLEVDHCPHREAELKPKMVKMRWPKVYCRSGAAPPPPCGWSPSPYRGGLGDFLFGLAPV